MKYLRTFVVMSALLYLPIVKATNCVAFHAGKNAIQTTIAAIAQEPSKYHGLRVEVFGFLLVDFENIAIYADKQTSTKLALWVSLDSGPLNTEEDVARYHRNYMFWSREFSKKSVSIAGVFDSKTRGHGSLYGGTLMDISKVCIENKGGKN